MRPILFSLGPISISSFGFFAAIAFLAASFLIWRFSQEELLFSKTPVEDEILFDGVFIFVLGSLIGARLIFVFSHFEKFGFNILRWILIKQTSGFSFLGGFLVGALLLFLFCLKKQLDFWDIFDIFSLGGVFALVFGFIGAFLDGVGVGAETTFPWGVVFVGLEGKRHPVQLLGAAFFLLCFLILKRVRLLALKKKLKKGVVAFCFLALLGLGLFFLEFLKEGDIYWKWFKKDHFLYLGIALVSSACFYKRLGRNLKKDASAFFQYFKSLRKIVKRK